MSKSIVTRSGPSTGAANPPTGMNSTPAVRRWCRRPEVGHGVGDLPVVDAVNRGQAVLR